jgi:hypothetical protein
MGTLFLKHRQRSAWYQDLATGLQKKPAGSASDGRGGARHPGSGQIAVLPSPVI